MPLQAFIATHESLPYSLSIGLLLGLYGKRAGLRLLKIVAGAHAKDGEPP